MAIDLSLVRQSEKVSGRFTSDISSINIFLLQASMASDAAPPEDGAVRVRKRRQKRESENRRREVLEVQEVQEIQEVNIKELTVAGHRALQKGRSHDALRCFSKAVKAAGQVRPLGASSPVPGSERGAHFSSCSLLLSCRTLMFSEPAPSIWAQRTLRQDNH